MTEHRTTASNSTYAAERQDDDIVIYDLRERGVRAKTLQCASSVAGSIGAVAFSDARAHYLAIAKAHLILVCDVEANVVATIIPGTGRAINSLSWSCPDDALIAAGAIDGTVAVWDLQHHPRPRASMYSAQAATSSVAFCPNDPRIIASSHGAWLYLWWLEQPSTPLRTIRTGDVAVQHIAWHPIINARLFTVCFHGVVKVWELSEILAAFAGPRVKQSALYSVGTFGELGHVPAPLRPIAEIRAGKSAAHVQWAGEHGTLISMSRRNEVVLYSHGAEFETLHEVWRLKLDEVSKLLAVIANSTGTWIVYTIQDVLEKHRVPAAVIDSVGGHAPARPSGHAKNERLAKAEGSNSAAKMKPVTLSQMRRETDGFRKTSQQIQTLRQRSLSGEHTIPRTPPTDVSTARLATPPSQIITANIGDQKRGAEDDDLLMPFLSPSIPARRLSPNTLPPSEYDLGLSSLRSASLDSIPSSAVHESDSDEETFDEVMRGSASFMPGGVNVPLPKACGALFAPNGQLVTFFPRKAVEPPDAVLGLDGIASARTGAKVARLFRSFGNLMTDLPAVESDVDFNSSDDLGLLDLSHQPALATLPLGLDGARSISTKTASANVAGTGRATIAVSVRSCGDVQPYNKSMTEQFRVLSEESGTNVCYHNAGVADRLDREDAAYNWRLLALVLEDWTAHEACDARLEHDDMGFAALRTSSLTRSDSGVEFYGAEQHDDSSKLNWSGHPFGSDWLVRRILEWAERRADLQTLACMSAILVEADSVRRTATPLLPGRQHTHGFDHLGGKEDRYAAQTSPRRIPLLRTDTTALSVLHESPTKLQEASRLSSRSTSQPTTPYPDSSLSTPPFSFPPFASQGSRLSTSGSASPEYHRSSFSAAARHYAQTVTDKFASYGASPPLRKDQLDNSPRSTNEVSSSLPSGGGSWSKSVSFASSMATSKASQMNLNHAAANDDYDSDETIEDPSPMRVRRNGPVAIKFKLRDEEHSSGLHFDRASTSLLPADMVLNATRWRQAYAEQLRSWGLLEQAAELTKLSDDVHSSYAHGSEDFRSGVAPMPAPERDRRAACSICYTAITHQQQFCPTCLHVSHLACIDSYCAGLDSNEAFECPSGCGCDCADLAFTVGQLHGEHFVPESNAASAATKILRKKASFTDPRRWRARVEGDSW